MKFNIQIYKLTVTNYQNGLKKVIKRSKTLENANERSGTFRNSHGTFMNGHKR
jgi:hypothetical protein